jgi:hypothetical protein
MLVSGKLSDWTARCSPDEVRAPDWTDWTVRNIASDPHCGANNAFPEAAKQICAGLRRRKRTNILPSREGKF